MGKHTLQVEYDYNFVLIGIVSQEKDYRVCWALNNKLELELTKSESLEIKGKKQDSPSYFSLYLYNQEDDFKEYSVISNFSESKISEKKTLNLFDDIKVTTAYSQNEWLIPEYKQMNYFFVIKGDVTEDEVEEIINKIQEIELIQAVLKINVEQLKSKQNLIY